MCNILYSFEQTSSPLSKGSSRGNKEPDESQYKEIRVRPVAKRQWSPGKSFHSFASLSSSVVFWAFLASCPPCAEVDTIGFLFRKATGKKDYASGEDKRRTEERRQGDEEQCTKVGPRVRFNLLITTWRRRGAEDNRAFNPRYSPDSPSSSPPDLLLSVKRTLERYYYDLSGRFLAHRDSLGIIFSVSSPSASFSVVAATSLSRLRISLMMLFRPKHEYSSFRLKFSSIQSANNMSSNVRPFFYPTLPSQRLHIFVRALFSFHPLALPDLFIRLTTNFTSLPISENRILCFPLFIKIPSILTTLSLCYTSCVTILYVWN